MPASLLQHQQHARLQVLHSISSWDFYAWGSTLFKVLALGVISTSGIQATTWPHEHPSPPLVLPLNRERQRETVHVQADVDSKPLQPTPRNIPSQRRSLQFRKQCLKSKESTGPPDVQESAEGPTKYRKNAL